MGEDLQFRHGAAAGRRAGTGGRRHGAESGSRRILHEGAHGLGLTENRVHGEGGPLRLRACVRGTYFFLTL